MSPKPPQRTATPWPSDDFANEPVTISDAHVIPTDASLEAELVEMDFTDKTPGARQVCPGCGGELAPYLSDSTDPPKDADEAWRFWSRLCVMTESNVWSFCPVTGVGWVPGRTRVDWERRSKAKPADQLQAGLERRTVRLPPPSGSQGARPPIAPREDDR